MVVLNILARSLYGRGPPFLARTAGRSHRMVQTVASNEFLGPLLISVGASSFDANTQRFQFYCGQSGLHSVFPFRQATNWPRRSQFRFVFTALPAIKRTVLPIGKLVDQFRPQGVAFDVSAAGEKVSVVVDRKNFESFLVKMASAEVAIACPISQGVGGGHPAQQSPHLAIFERSNAQMRVVGHQSIPKQFERVPLQTFGKHSFEGEEIFLLVKQRLPLIFAIEGMVHLPGWVVTWLSVHQTLRWWIFQP